MNAIDFHSQTDDDICQLPSRSGMCLAYIPSWHHNSQTGQCEEFIYGGCDGNDNKFPTKEACEEKCKK